VPESYEDPGLVEIHPLLIRRVGRGGALVDAQLADPNARAIDHEVVYSEGDAAGFVCDEIERLGPSGFRDRYDVPVDTADKIKAGRQPSAVTVRRVLTVLARGDGGLVRSCALKGCNQLLDRGARKFCSPAHAKAHRVSSPRNLNPARPIQS
jgi:hypothetical protein